MSKSKIISELEMEQMNKELPEFSWGPHVERFAQWAASVDTTIVRPPRRPILTC